MPPLSTEAEARFNALLDIFPSLGPTETAYVDHARKRGWLTLQHLPPGTGSEAILDVGSMRGLFGPAYMDLWRYHAVSLLGHDLPSGNRLAYEGRDGKTYEFGIARCNIEIEAWPFDTNVFDTVVCMEVLEHLVFDPAFAMNEICRVLRPGGHALISVPNAASDECIAFAANDMQPGFLRHYISDALRSGDRSLNTVYHMGHFHEYTRTELECLARACGFEVVRIAGIAPRSPFLQSPRFSLLRKLVHVLFPRSRRIREPLIVALLRKSTFTPLDQLPHRYPEPLYRPLSR